MKTFVLFLACLGCLLVSAQKIQVIVPTQPVVVGTAFQVQYIITEPSAFVDASTPVFDSCRLISGPHIYKGNATVDGKLQPIQNVAYTLIPSKTGVLQIGAIKARFKGGIEVQSGSAGITVVAKPKASFSVRSSYTDVQLYASPSRSDREKLIEDNLFIKTEVDKRVCTEGEPVVATFKLYSRLQSSSEAQKSPAFYGFSVVDMLNINEAHNAVETVNGKIFNTSILRQVQLYPVQAGDLVIDEMYVQNEVEFEDSITHSKTKMEKEIVTRPIHITVKPLPQDKDEYFTGAVGDFAISGHLEKRSIYKNGQGKLIVIVSGKGNFIQFGPPVVNWPKGMEPFEPTVEDKLNKNTAPIEGERIYSFGFAVDTAGSYRIPDVSFSYFDLASADFKQIVAGGLSLHVTEGQRGVTMSRFRSKGTVNYLWLVLLLVVVATGGFFWLRSRKKTPLAQTNVVKSVSRRNYLQELAALDANEKNAQHTCVEIQKILFAFSRDASSMLDAQQRQAITSVIEECQLQIYCMQCDREKVEELKLRAARLVKSG